MESKDNYIKMDGEKDSFEGGAIRYTKKGKGRYDLIPSQQIHDILNYAKLNWDKIIEKDNEFCSVHYVLMSAYPDADDLTYENYIEIIINIVRYSYTIASHNKIFDAFMRGFVKMLKDLAIHYEMGAEKYGVDNWKNGIPETKGDRGGSFRDSGLRHLQQLLDGKTDEPHRIAAIWNFIGAMYVKKHQDVKRTTLKKFDDEVVIDLSRPDTSFRNICFISTNGNEFKVSFGNGTNYELNDIQTYSFKKDKISVARSISYLDGKREEIYTITGTALVSHELIKIDLICSFDTRNRDCTVNMNILKGYNIDQHGDIFIFELKHKSYPKLIENALWDKLYDAVLKDIVTEISPV